MSRPLAQLESLESRQFLSAASTLPPVYGALNFGVSLAQQRQAQKAAEYQALVDKSVAIGKAHNVTPSILGQWKGRAKAGAFFVSKKVDVTLDITKVTPKFAKGTLTVDGRTYSGRIPGKTKPTHEFSYTFTRGDDSVTVSGLLNGRNTAANGTLSAKYDGWKINGTFSLTKIRPTTGS